MNVVLILISTNPLLRHARVGKQPQHTHHKRFFLSWGELSCSKLNPNYLIYANGYCQQFHSYIFCEHYKQNTYHFFANFQTNISTVTKGWREYSQSNGQYDDQIRIKGAFHTLCAWSIIHIFFIYIYLGSQPCPFIIDIYCDHYNLMHSRI